MGRGREVEDGIPHVVDDHVHFQLDSTLGARETFLVLQLVPPLLTRFDLEKSPKAGQMQRDLDLITGLVTLT